MTRTRVPNLPRKDVEDLLRILERAAQQHGKTIRFHLNGTGHVGVYDRYGERPYRLRDGRPFTIPTTPARHGKWKQRAIQEAAECGLVSRRQLTSGDRRSQREKDEQELVELRKKIAQLEKRLAA